ncbi:hypothetical protein [Chryseobacterium jejuense]|uniref:Lipoprotein n=1 Tax=Chryseobacterium jejuense TaxID=445960 RepID=A0A2X2X2C8_CHRJE|nr:hypothetical protein [Chryseobacterium jejuense]SDI30819.1 hypothetical protein SAMN05421542_0787 [Chryseobacterium jejuense]SQB44721.1 Uncharacterised protein [Chryseobacterium jejuense]
MRILYNRLNWILIPSFIIICSCSKEKKELSQTKNEAVSAKANTNDSVEVLHTVVDTKKDPADFVPKGYKIFEKSYGDLNKDGLEDCMLIIKKIDAANIVNHESRGKLDMNRRGIIVLFKNQNGYQLAAENDSCFSSENEDGGVYYSPELLVEAEKGNLIVHYAHGRYGYWRYIFRYQNAGFELIGYDESSNNGPLVNSATSINFSTKKKRKDTNTNEEAVGGDEIFETTWTNIKITKLLTLTEIKDFDELEMSY